MALPIRNVLPPVRCPRRHVIVALAATFSPGSGVMLAISTIVSCVAVSGAGLLFARSPAAYTLLKAAGAAYLAVACSNPKSILFFTAIFPQFLPVQHMTGPRFLLLSLAFVACMFVSHLSYVLVTAKAGAHLLDAGCMRVLRQVMGVLFVLMAIAMLVTNS